MVLYYAYILKLSNNSFYVGRTDNIDRRLNEHKSGQQRTTKKYLPLELEIYIAFKKKAKAIKFEKYLKTGSGFAFRNRHLV